MPRMAVVWAWPVPWAGMAAVGCGQSYGPYMGAVGAWLVPWARMAAVGVWPVHWAPYGRRGSVVGPLCLVWQPWRRGPSQGPRMVVLGAWPVP